MPSARTRANRLNAQRSTGPRTASGKAAAAQNARTHGLSARAKGQRGNGRSALFAEIASQSLSPESQLLAELVADAQAAVIDVARVIAQQIQEMESPGDEALVMLERLARYDRRAQSRLRSAVKLFDRSRERQDEALD